MNKTMSLADSIEKYSYMKAFSHEQLDEMRIELTDVAIELDKLETELGDIKDDYKARMKPSKLRLSGLLTNLRQKAEYITEDCHVFFEQEIGMAVYHDASGVEVGRRPLVASERNATVFSEMRKVANE